MKNTGASGIVHRLTILVFQYCKCTILVHPVLYSLIIRHRTSHRFFDWSTLFEDGWKWVVFTLYANASKKGCSMLKLRKMVNQKLLLHGTQSGLYSHIPPRNLVSALQTLVTRTDTTTICWLWNLFAHLNFGHESLRMVCCIMIVLLH
jgi:hypothetical protein